MLKLILIFLLCLSVSACGSPPIEGHDRPGAAYTEKVRDYGLIGVGPGGPGHGF